MSALQQISETPSPKRILIIDDEEILRFALQLTLSTAGHEALCADDCQSAMNICHSSPPELVILDYRMPEINGLELARLLRRIEPPTKIALCSAHIDDHIMLEALSLGIVDFIPKPILPQDLRELVGHILMPLEIGVDPLTSLLHEMRHGRFEEALHHASTLSQQADCHCQAQAWKTVLDAAIAGQIADYQHFVRSNIHDLLFR